MNRIFTYISGRALSLFLIVSFNILIVKLSSPQEYAIYAVLIAGASIANTAAGLGSQRLVPKVIGMAGRQITSKRASKIYGAILTIRLVLLIIVSAITFDLYKWFTSENLSISASLLVPYVIFSSLSSIYVDVEAASQSLNQQRLSRIVAIGEPSLRLALVAVIAFVHGGMTALHFIEVSCLTQLLATVALALNNFRFLRRPSQGALPDPQDVALRDLLGLAGAAYLGGFAWISTAPPTLRLLAASVLPAPAIAVLSFVQSLGASFQRYSPGFLILPFVEAQIMRRGRGGDLSLVSAALSLVWKVDMIVSLVLICVISPAAPTLLTLAARHEFAAYGMYIGLVLLPVPLGTIYRALEVGSVFVNAYGEIVRASALTLISFVLLLVFRSTLGVMFILLIPVLDNLIRCGFLERQLHRRGLPNVVEWPKLLLLLCFAITVTLASSLATRLTLPGQVAGSIILTAVGLLLIRTMRLISVAEFAVFEGRLPRRAMPVLGSLLGHRSVVT